MHHHLRSSIILSRERGGPRFVENVKEEDMNDDVSSFQNLSILLQCTVLNSTIAPVRQSASS